jgi:hypothetical protein
MTDSHLQGSVTIIISLQPIALTQLSTTDLIFLLVLNSRQILGTKSCGCIVPIPTVFSVYFYIYDEFAVLTICSSTHRYFLISIFSITIRFNIK